VCDGGVELIHHEKVSRGATRARSDRVRFQRRWESVFADGDPFYHPALSPDATYDLVA
jgi:hypothetical protein